MTVGAAENGETQITSGVTAGDKVLEREITFKAPGGGAAASSAAPASGGFRAAASRGFGGGGGGFPAAVAAERALRRGREQRGWQ